MHRRQFEIFWLHQTLHEELADVIIRVLLYDCTGSLILESRAQFLRLLLKLVNGNLSHKHGKILNGRLISGIAHRDVSLIG